MARTEEPQFELVPISPTRKAIGERVGKSKTEAPEFIVWTEVEASRLVEDRRARQSRGDAVVPTYNDYLLQIVARHLRKYPRFNAWYAEDGLKVFREVNVGFAVGTPEGVLLPTLFHADEKPLTQIATEARGLVEQARAGKLRASLQRNAGFTLSNIGPLGIDAFEAIISPPQVAILAIGTMAPRPVVRDGAVVVRPTMVFTLTVDHRANDGAEAGQFLSDLKAAIENWAGE